MLIKLLSEIVSNHPEKTAVVYDSLRISYQELDSKVRSLSEGLRSIGVVEGDCVALLLPNCPEFIISFYAIAKLNGIVLPLNHLFEVEEISSYYLNDSDVRVIITDSKRADICLSILSNLDKKIELVVVDKAQTPAKYFFGVPIQQHYGCTEAGAVSINKASPMVTTIYRSLTNKRLRMEHF